jgi:hypothetical protein
MHHPRQQGLVKNAQQVVLERRSSRAEEENKTSLLHQQRMAHVRGAFQ